MRTQDLLVFLVPDEGADLAVGVHSADVFAGFDVPEAHGLVRSSSSSCQQIPLPGAPGQSLDCRFMTEQLISDFASIEIPNQSLVVIASGSKSARIMLQSTHLSSVPQELLRNVLMSSVVVSNNGRIFGPGKQHSIGEGGRRGSIFMAPESPDKCFSFDIIKFNLSAGESDSQLVSLRMGGQRANVIIFFLAEFADISGRVQIYALAQTDGENSFAAPVKQVQIVVVLDLRGIQDLFGGEVDITFGRLLLDDFAALGEELLDFGHAVVGGEVVLIDHGFLQDLLGEEVLVALAVFGDHGLRVRLALVGVASRAGRNEPVVNLLAAGVIGHIRQKIQQYPAYEIQRPSSQKQYITLQYIQRQNSNLAKLRTQCQQHLLPTYPDNLIQLL